VASFHLGQIKPDKKGREIGSLEDFVSYA